MNLQDLTKFVASTDLLSWLAHFLICAAFTYMAGIVGALEAVLVSEILVVYFAMREGSNWKTHKVKGHARSRYLWDGIGDMLGPILCHGYAWAVFLGTLTF